MQVTKSNGSKQEFDVAKIMAHSEWACRGLNVLQSELDASLSIQFYEGMPTAEIAQAQISTASSLISLEQPEFDKVTARFVLQRIYKQVTGGDIKYPSIKAMLSQGVLFQQLDPRLVDGRFDLEAIDAAITPERDDLFAYLGIQTVADRYLLTRPLTSAGKKAIYEMPQHFWMRVAMGLSILEDNPTARAIEAYNVFSQMDYVPSTPTLFNSGTRHSQMSSCYLSYVPDDLELIFDLGITQSALLSKFAGGVGTDWTEVRANKSVIKSTNGKSNGIVPFLKIYNQTAVAVNQCFAPDTLVRVKSGVKPISEVIVGDIVLGEQGKYREVLEVMAYDQDDKPMVSLKVKHSIDPVRVTSGHPIFAIKGVAKEQSIKRTMAKLEAGKLKADWVDAGDISEGDYVAQVIPSEVVAVPGFTEEDARMYGIMLGDGHITTRSAEFGVTGADENTPVMKFVAEYLAKKGLHSWAAQSGDTARAIRWSKGQLPFDYDDLYDEEGNKRIAARLSHLPRAHTLALLQGLIETDGNVSRGKELTFVNSSHDLIEGLRYQALRVGIPTSGQKRERSNAHLKNCKKPTSVSWTVRIPAVESLASLLGCEALTKLNWLHHGNKIYSRVIEAVNIDPLPVVHDLKVEGDESYSTTFGLVHNGGKRKGAFSPYLEIWHDDFTDYCDLRLQTGDDNLRTHDIHPAAWVPDLFMERKEAGAMWSFFCPSDVPGLHDLHGEAFKKAYEAAEAAGLARRQLPAMDVWKNHLDKLVRTGYPWITFKDACNRRNPQAHVGVIHNSNLCCVSADQRAATDKGLLTVAELYAMQEPVKVSARNGEIKQGSVMYLPRPDAPMVEIQTKQGFTHKVTPDHKVWVVGKGRVEAQHLVDGDKIELQTVGQFGIEHDPAIAFIMGLVAGDGTYSESGVRIDLWKGKTDHLKDEVEAVVAAVIARHYKPVAAPTPANLQPKFKIYKKKISLDSSALAQVLSKFGFCKKTKHSVPTLVWQGTRETVVQYLRGLYLTDATTASGSTNNVFVVLAQANERLLKDVQMLWLNLGVISSLTKMRDASKRMMPDGKGGKKEYECQAMYRLGISSSEACNIVESLIGIGAARNNEMFLECLAKPTRNQNQKTYCTFTHLVELPNEDAYCLQVESDEHVWTVNGMISSNTEITLINSKEETAVCNLGSIVLGNHVRNGQIDSDKLQRTIKVAVRCLDNVIDLNYYPTPETERSNLRHRPIGLGVMGYAEAMLQCGIDWESQDHLEWADETFEQINFYSIKASMELAKERGAYPTFPGSTWSQGKLTIDTAKDQKVNFFSPVEWQLLREDVVKYGIRNSNITAIAPTATIANIVGTTECIQLINERVIIKDNLSGRFDQINPLHKYNRPELVKTVWEVDQLWSIKAAARRQKWIDQSQSLNLYKTKDIKGRTLDIWYTTAWKLDVKTTYYLRNQGATDGAARIEDVKQEVLTPPVPAAEQPVTSYFECEACQ